MNTTKRPIPIEGLEKYFATNNGNIYSETTKRYLKTSISTGYYKVVIKRKSYNVHRLIALAFLEPEEGKDQVNHKDGDKLNNNVDNLEWCSRSENCRHYMDTLGGDKASRNKRAVQQLTKKGELISTYESAQEASTATGIHKTNITMVCRGQRITSGGYKWRYVENDVKETDLTEFQPYPGNKEYLVSKRGEIYSTKRNRLLCSSQHLDGKLMVTVTNGRGKTIRKIVSHMVAETYIPNPKEYSNILHKDGNKTNVNVENLKWTTHEKIVRRPKERADLRPIDQYDMQGNYIRTHVSVSEAERFLGVKPCSAIARCLSGKGRASCGYRWAYKGMPLIDKKNRDKRAVIKIDPETDEELETYESITEANKCMGVKSSHIQQVCAGSREKALGYKWRYADD